MLDTIHGSGTASVSMEEMILPGRCPDPVPWRAGLRGDFAGQACVLHLGSARVSMLFRWCPPTPPGEPAWLGKKSALSEVRIPEGFWLAQHPVNRCQWRAVMGGELDDAEAGGNLPQDSVSWDDAQEFCRRAGLRLPREQEWEYACRAGRTSDFAVGDGLALNSQLANIDGNHPAGSGPGVFKWRYLRTTAPEGSYPPNAWGLHEMHGQLWEWCEDAWDARCRVLRGGSWSGYGWIAEAGQRRGFAPGGRSVYFGFRPCPSSTSQEVKPASAGQGVKRGTSGATVPRG